MISLRGRLQHYPAMQRRHGHGLTSSARELRPFVTFAEAKGAALWRQGHCRRTRSLHAVYRGRPDLLATVRTAYGVLPCGRRTGFAVQSLGVSYLALSSGSSDTLYWLAVASANLGKLDRAERISEALLARAEQEPWPRAHLIMGMV